MSISGVWLPIVTPFNKGQIDFDSYERLINHYIDAGITGIMANATTGESPVLSDHEQQELLEKTVEFVNHRVPLYWGAGGNSTAKLTEYLKTITDSGIDGILSVSPYYNRPSQEGIYKHFRALSDSTTLPIIIYNIPYRTGMNMDNKTILKCAEIHNIIGIKDSSGDINQTMELLREAPDHFSIFTGEDALFFLNLVSGGSGGILASAHLNTNMFIDIYNLVKGNNHKKALKIWDKISGVIPFLFKETNPGPIKHLLKKMDLIRSEELRLPLTGVSKEYRNRLNSLFNI